MPKRNLILIVAIIAAAACVIVFTRNNGQVDLRGNGHSPVRPVADVFGIIREHYVGPIKDDKLLCDAIGGMVGGLDEHSKYIPPEKVESFNARMRGNYRGLGLKVEVSSAGVVVIGPMLDWPADRAGFQTGDRILSIDKQDVRGLTLAQVNDLLDGGPGDNVSIVFQRGSERPKLELSRVEKELQTVTGLFRNHAGQWVYMLNQKDGIAYVRIREFCPKTADQLDQVLRQLPMVKSIVLDLRDNPGGGLLPAVGVANLFIRDGLIVKSINRDKQQELYKAHPEKAWSDTVPLVVLVNGQTASAAEIVAGSLWVRSRAVVMGTRTRGKGSVQSLFALGDMGQISLTTSEYLLDGNIRISRRAGNPGGIVPQVEVAETHQEELAAIRLRGEVRFRPTPETMPASWPDDKDGLTDSFLALDAPLARALKMLGDPKEYQAVLKQAAAAMTRPATSSGPAEPADE